MSATATSWEVAVDIGGTFTDVVAVHGVTGERVDGKVLTTPLDPVIGISNALDLVQGRGVDVDRATYFVHATTLAINTLIQRRGARMAMLTTRGVRDVIEPGRERRYDLYDLQIDMHEPLVERQLRFGVEERVDARGAVLTPLNVDDVGVAIRAMGDVEAIAVCFLHSYANATHEELAAAVVREQCPGVYVCTSADIAPIIREYERFTLATVNAYIAPRVAAYLHELAATLGRRGFSGAIGVVKSDGGMCTIAEAAEVPVRILESGPAAGILSAADTARSCGELLALAFDMGGTTAKACLVAEGEPAFTSELQVARLKRFVSGSGIPLRMSSVDVIEIGAGGGSIARIDELGVLQVGPQSAGAEPGPACYGLGGLKPSVTDADLVLGYLDPKSFAGGSMELDLDLADQAIANHILGPSGTDDLTLAAWAIHDVVNESMARAARRHCLEHGVDPRSVTVVATGGAGPVHAAWVAAKLGAKRVVFPPSAGVASAWGLLLAPRSAEAMVSRICAVDSLTDDELCERLDAIESALRREHPGRYTASAHVEMRLAGQQYEIRVDLPPERTVAALQSAFETEYALRFGRAPWSDRREIVNWCMRLTQSRSVLVNGRPAHQDTASSVGGRRAYFGPADGWLDAVVTSREALRRGDEAFGPMIIAEDDTTIVVPPGYAVRCDEHGNVVIDDLGPARTSQLIEAVTADAHAQGR